jgi:hypothetical protein
MAAEQYLRVIKVILFIANGAFVSKSRSFMLHGFNNVSSQWFEAHAIFIPIWPVVLVEIVEFPLAAIEGIVQGHQRHSLNL